MASAPGDSWGMRVTGFFLKCSGFWPMDSQCGKLAMTLLSTYSLLAIISATILICIDMYYNVGDFEKFIYCSLNLFSSAFGLWKLFIFTPKRKLFLNLATYAQKHYWFVSYDGYAADVMRQCMVKCTVLVVYAAISCHVAMIIYYLRPIFENRGKHESERVFPFKFYSNLPITITPWYEILYIVQIITFHPCCIAYFCFDNLLCQINITIFGQFVILQKEIRDICREQNELYDSDQKYIHLKFVSCIQKHQELINFVKNVKEMYRNEILGVVVGLCFLICIELYQLLMSSGGILTKVQYGVFASGSITQLYFYILSCDNLTQASLAIADAAYDVRWFLITSETFKNQLVKDLSMIMMRSQRACSLTVGNFTPVTLQTFTSICNTAFSFLTLIRQSVNRKLENGVE